MKKSIFYRLSLYVIFFSLQFLLVGFFWGHKHTSVVIEKTERFREISPYINLVFLGDSRTYTGIHPLLIDKELKTRSVNLAEYAHWFPTQLPQFEALIPHIKKGTTVVWSVGYQNFGRVGESRWALWNKFFIGYDNIFKYIYLGVGIKPVLSHVWKCSNTYYGLEKLKKSYDSNLSLLKNELWSSSNTDYVDTQPDTSNESKLDYSTKVEYEGEIINVYQLNYFLKKDPSISKTEAIFDKDKLTSLVAYDNRGSYDKIEIDKDFFREKQQEQLEELLKTNNNQFFEPDEAYWHLFVEAIDLFKKNNIDLIINEIGEAPYVSTFAGPSGENFMREKVKPYVISRGIPYIRAPLEILEDDDFFDYNHLNHKGGLKYNKMLVQELKPFIIRKGLKK